MCGKPIYRCVLFLLTLLFGFSTQAADYPELVRDIENRLDKTVQLYQQNNTDEYQPAVPYVFFH